MLRIPPQWANAAFQTLHRASVAFQDLEDRADSFALRNSLYAYAYTLAPRASAGAERLYGALDGMKLRVQTNPAYIDAFFSQFPHIVGHPSADLLLELVREPATEDSEGFSQISEMTFRRFVDGVPHLFSDGESLLRWFDDFDAILDRNESSDLLRQETRINAKRVSKALRTMVMTAAVTAPSDLWLMRQILATHAANGLLDLLENRREVISREDAPLLNMNERQMLDDLDFLHSRGLLDRVADGFSKSPRVNFRFGRNLELPSEFRTDMAGLLRRGFEGSADLEENDLVERWLRLPWAQTKSSGWVPGLRELEIGYRVLPLVLALKASGRIQGLKTGARFPEVPWAEGIARILTAAGFVSQGRVTALGARAFERGPGAYGIIGAYHPYLKEHEALLSESRTRPSVERGANIAASRDANRANFRAAVEILSAYARDNGSNYSVVIEHALGLGIGIQEFIAAFGTGDRRFFGADYEETALQGALKEQSEGRLPATMKFIQADIARPKPLIDYLATEGVLDVPLGQKVMIVGNGFHEARGKTDEEMIALLREYREAGFLIVFTEESGLTRQQIRSAAWNTYHAGFRWTHQTSGQVLRSPYPMNPPAERLSWVEVFERAGYTVPQKFRRGTRPVFPCRLPEEMNPPISATFLCLP